MNCGNIENRSGCDIYILEYLEHLIGLEFLVLSVGYALHQVSHLFLHGSGQAEAKLLLEHECNASLTRGGIDTDDIGFILSSDVRRIDGNIGDIPALSGLTLCAVIHSLADGILV